MSTKLMESVVEQGHSQKRADKFRWANDHDIGYESNFCLCLLCLH